MILPADARASSWLIVDETLGRDADHRLQSGHQQHRDKLITQHGP